MKNIFKVFGIIPLLAVIGFSMSACDNGGGGGLVGKWQTSTGDFIITFTATKFTLKNDSGLEFYSGTYKFDPSTGEGTLNFDPSTGTGTLNDEGGDMFFILRSDGLLNVNDGLLIFRKKWDITEVEKGEKSLFFE